MGGFRNHFIAFRNIMMKIVIAVCLTYTLGFLKSYSPHHSHRSAISTVQPLIYRRKVSTELGQAVRIITSNESQPVQNQPSFHMFPDVPERQWMDKARERFDYVEEIFLSSIFYESVDVHAQHKWNFTLNTEPCLSARAIIVVPSTTTNFAARINIRKSWGMSEELGRLGFCLRYFVGMPRTKDRVITKRLIEENRDIGDVIQLNIRESYNNLTLKSLGMLTWARKYAQNTQYVFKIDDDVVVHIDRLLAVTEKARVMHPRFILGRAFLNMAIRPVMYRKSKFFDPIFETVYNQEAYPDYINGPVYVMPSSIVSEVLEAALKAPLMQMEDVFITGICRHIANNITLVHVQQDISVMRKFCVLNNKNFIFSHNHSPTSIRTHWLRQSIRQCEATLILK